MKLLVYEYQSMPLSTAKFREVFGKPFCQVKLQAPVGKSIIDDLGKCNKNQCGDEHEQHKASTKPSTRTRTQH